MPTEDAIYQKCRDRLFDDLGYRPLMEAWHALLESCQRYQKAGYRPDEPRDEYGRWTDSGATESQSDGSMQYADNQRYAMGMSDAVPDTDGESSKPALETAASSLTETAAANQKSTHMEEVNAQDLSGEH